MIKTEYQDIVNTIKVGDRVSTKLNGIDYDSEYFTGIIYNINKEPDPNRFRYGIIVDIKRDDGKTGSGLDSMWTTLVTPDNCHAFNILNQDWDD
jgi:hypothetical protein